MKTLYALVCLLLLADVAFGEQPPPILYAVEGYPGFHSAINGKYGYENTDATGHAEYGSIRSDATFFGPISIKWNPVPGRWELKAGLRSSGATRIIMMCYTAGKYPPSSGWGVPKADYSGIALNLPAVKMYPSTTIYSVRAGSWSNVTTWSTGFLPRAYDDVILNNNVTMDIDGTCANLIINSTTAPTPPIRFYGSIGKKLKMKGNLTIYGNSEMEIYTLSFEGNFIQTIGTNPGSTLRFRAWNVNVYNPAGLRLHGSFSFVSPSPYHMCVTNLSVGKIYLGNYNLECQTIIGADRARYIVTDGTGYLTLPANIEGETYSRLFPIGISSTSYTPVRVYYPSTSPGIQLQARIRSDFSGLSASLPRVNARYEIRPVGTAVTSSRSYSITPFWYASDESAGFDGSQTCTIYKKQPDGTWAIVPGSEAMPYYMSTGSYQVTFATTQPAIQFAVCRRSSGGTRRLAADETKRASLPSMSELQHTVYPNPITSDGFNVEVADAANARLEMVSPHGTTLDVATRIASDHSIFVKLPSQRAAGVYILKIHEGSAVVTRRVMVP